ncbi:MAG: STAS domain-containing protein [Acidimicrobiales bacterium]
MTHFGAPGLDGPRIEVTVIEADDESVVAVCGEIDQTTSDRVWDGIERAAEKGGPVVVDLSRTTFIDSAGIRVLIRAWRQLGEQPRSLIVRSPSATARHLFEITGIDAYLTVEGQPEDP